MSRSHPSLRRLEALATAAPAAIAGLEREDALLAPLLRELDDLDLVSAALLAPLVEPADLSAALAGRLGRQRRSRRAVPRPARPGAPPEIPARPWSAAEPAAAETSTAETRSIPADPERVAELLRRYGPGEAPVIQTEGHHSLASSPTVPLGVNVPVAGAFPRPTSPPRSPSPPRPSAGRFPTPGRGGSLKFPRFPETLVQERVERGRPSPGGGGAMGEGSGVRSGGGRLAGEGLSGKLTPMPTIPHSTPGFETSAKIAALLQRLVPTAPATAADPEAPPQDAGVPTAGPAGVRLEAILDRLRTGARLRPSPRQRRTAAAAGAPPAPAAGLSAPPPPARGLRALAALGTALPADPRTAGGEPSPPAGESASVPPWDGGEPLAAELSADDLAARIDRLLRREARRHGIEVDAP